MSYSLAEKLNQLAAKNIGRTTLSAPLSAHNSWKIGGNADLLIEPATPEDVTSVVKYARAESIPLVIIGQGTNLLFDDAGVRGIVLKIGEKLSRLEITGHTIVAGGGVWVPQLARQTMLAGLTGLEHCIGIPGTLGGLVVMNGGSHQRGIGENVVSVTIVDREGQPSQLSGDECHFAYRKSSLQALECVVVEVELCCQRRERKAIRREMAEDLRMRRSKFPRKQPNCGSVFLSTAEMYTTVGPPGKIIEDLGLKGLKVGGAEISHQHANFIVNLGTATAADVLALISCIRQKVREKISFELDCEVRYVDPQGIIVPAHVEADHSYTRLKKQ